MTRAGTRRSTPSSATTAAGPSTTCWPACRASVPSVVVDLGCGPGELTLTLADRWPAARVVGIDSSPEMLARARDVDADGPGRVGRGRRRDWDPTARGAVDVLVTNATLQWVPTHLRLLPAGSRRSLPVASSRCRCPPTSTRRRTGSCARSPPGIRAPTSSRRDSTAPTPSPCPRRMPPCSSRTPVRWTCGRRPTCRCSPPSPDAPHPVLEWVRGTGLRPVLGVLTDEDGARGLPRRLRARARGGIPPARRRRALPLHADLRRGPDAGMMTTSSAKVRHETGRATSH